jgi:hypothetical protein
MKPQGVVQSASKGHRCVSNDRNGAELGHCAALNFAELVVEPTGSARD